MVIDARMAAKMDGSFVVFLIGMRTNKPWKPQKWVPVFLAMPRMLKELERRPKEETGFLGHNGLSLGTIVQYWRSFDDLERYARDHDALHWPAWLDFNRKMKRSRGDVGIWHETYLVREGQYEAIYSGMPAHGLGRVGTLVAATGTREDARKRLAP